MKRVIALVLLIGLTLLCMVACGPKTQVLESPAGAFEVGKFVFRDDFGEGQYPAEGNKFLTVYIAPTTDLGDDVTNTLRETFCEADPAQIDASIGDFLCSSIGYEFSQKSDEQRYALLFEVPASLEEAGSITLVFPGGATAVLREQ